MLAQPARKRRRCEGTTAVEMACCLPLLSLILTGMLQVGRITEIQQVAWNSAREAARDASLGSDNLQAVANNLLAYLQSAEQTAFGKGHSTSMIAPVVSLPANTTGYTCWDNTANRELFTITFSDLSDTSDTDPTMMSQLDLYRLGVQIPYASVALTSVIPIANTTRLNVSVVWASMVDAPFSITPSLPAE
jgi:Flp pilus assembly protein TadG